VSAVLPDQHPDADVPLAVEGHRNPFATAPPMTLCANCGAVTEASNEGDDDEPIYMTEDVFCESCSATWRERWRRRERRQRRSAGSCSSALLSFEQVLNQAPPRWLIAGLVPEGLSVLYGAPGSFKSFLALDWACCVAAGIPWHGHEVEQGDVLYIAAEGAGGMKRRAAAWWDEHGRPDMSRWHLLPEAKNLLDDDAVHELKALVYEVEPVLLVVDTLARSMVGGEENSAKDVGRVVRALDSFARLPRLGIPFTDEEPPPDLNVLSRLVVHHTAKDGQVERGSGALRGAADLMVKTERIEGKSRTDVKCAYIKDGEEFPTITLEGRMLELEDGSTLALDLVPPLQAGVDRVDDLRLAVLKFVGEHGPVSRTQIEQGVSGLPAAIAQALDGLVAEGKLAEQRTGSKRGTRTYSLSVAPVTA
jgi:hypothetical protein